MAHSGMDLFLGNIVSRGREALSARPTGANQLSVGLGGDIPVFPPIMVVLLVALGFLLKACLPQRPLLPRPLRGLALRLAVFAAGLGFMLSTLSATDAELKRRGHGVNFAAIPEKDGLATGGPFSWSRNPIYAAGMLALLPAVCIASNSVYLLLAAMPLPLYLQFVVIPAEEALLARLFGDAYAGYCASVPRWVAVPW